MLGIKCLNEVQSDEIVESLAEKVQTWDMCRVDFLSTTPLDVVAILRFVVHVKVLKQLYLNNIPLNGSLKAAFVLFLDKKWTISDKLVSLYLIDCHVEDEHLARP